jgi:hypothetical protein
MAGGAEAHRFRCRPRRRTPEKEKAVKESSRSAATPRLSTIKFKPMSTVCSHQISQVMKRGIEIGGWWRRRKAKGLQTQVCNPLT